MLAACALFNLHKPPLYNQYNACYHKSQQISQHLLYMYHFKIIILDFILLHLSRNIPLINLVALRDTFKDPHLTYHSVPTEHDKGPHGRTKKKEKKKAASY